MRYRITGILPAEAEHRTIWHYLPANARKMRFPSAEDAVLWANANSNGSQGPMPEWIGIREDSGKFIIAALLLALMWALLYGATHPMASGMHGPDPLGLAGRPR